MPPSPTPFSGNEPAPTPAQAGEPGLAITNRRGGQVIELTADGPVDEETWPGVERRLLVLVSVRQPSELHLDIPGLDAIPGHPACLDRVIAALDEFGGRLVAGFGSDAGERPGPSRTQCV